MNRAVWIIVVALQVIFLSVTTVTIAIAAPASAKKTVSLDSGYIPQLATNHSMWNLWMEYSYLGAGIFDSVGKNSFMADFFLTRFAWELGMFVAWTYADYGFFVANHELGHGTRLIAIGGQPTYAWNGGRYYSSIFPFILDGYGHFGGGAVTNGMGGSYSPPDWNITVSAAGMNNSAMYGEALEDEAYYNGGHIIQLGSFISSKLDAYNYARNSTTMQGQGDVAAILSAWRGKGYNITSSDVASGSMNAFMGNFTTAAYLWSLLRYVAVGDPTVNSFSLGRVKLPDLSFFQNRDGLSYRLRTALKTDSKVFPLSLEYVYKGRSVLELSMGWRYLESIAGVKKTGSIYQLFVNSKGGWGVRAAKDFPSSGRNFFSLGASIFQVDSLEGERNLGRFSSDTLAEEVWGKMSWVY